MEVFSYRKLIAYQKGKEVVKRTYQLLKKFPAEERYAMCDQLRRASVSITSNIAEGVNRFSMKDKVHFIEIAFGSLMRCLRNSRFLRIWVISPQMNVSAWMT